MENKTQKKFDFAKQVLESAAKQGIIPQDLVEAQMKILQQEETKKYSGVSLVNIYDIQKTATLSREFKGVASGIKSLDDKLLGFREGDLVCVGGCSNIGKSTMTMLWGKNMAKAGVKTLYMFFEDGADEVGSRANLLDKGMGFTEKEGKGNIFLFPMSALAPFYKEPEEIIPAIRAMVRTAGIKVVFIDMINDLVKVNTADQADELVRDLKLLAEELKITIVFTARLRKPMTGMGNATYQNSKYFPESDCIAGFNSLEFLATKIILLSEVPQSVCPSVSQQSFEDPEIRSFAVHVTKNRTGKKTVGLNGAIVGCWRQFNDKTIFDEVGFTNYDADGPIGNE